MGYHQGRRAHKLHQKKKSGICLSLSDLVVVLFVVAAAAAAAMGPRAAGHVAPHDLDHLVGVVLARRAMVALATRAPFYLDHLALGTRRG